MRVKAACVCARHCTPAHLHRVVPHQPMQATVAVAWGGKRAVYPRQQNSRSLAMGQMRDARMPTLLAPSGCTPAWMHWRIRASHWVAGQDMLHAQRHCRSPMRAPMQRMAPTARFTEMRASLPACPPPCRHTPSPACVLTHARSNGSLPVPNIPRTPCPPHSLTRSCKPPSAPRTRAPLTSRPHAAGLCWASSRRGSSSGRGRQSACWWWAGTRCRALWTGGIEVSGRVFGRGAGAVQGCRRCRGGRCCVAQGDVGCCQGWCCQGWCCGCRCWDG